MHECRQPQWIVKQSDDHKPFYGRQNRFGYPRFGYLGDGAASGELGEDEAILAAGPFCRKYDQKILTRKFSAGIPV